jgi:hypothetical protein
MEILNKERLHYCHLVCHKRHTDYPGIKVWPQQLHQGISDLIIYRAIALAVGRHVVSTEVRF